MNVLEQKWRACPKKPQVDGSKFESPGKWEGNVLCALGFKCVFLFS